MAKLALQDVLDMVDEEADKMGVDPDLGKAIVVAENFNKEAVGKALAAPQKYSIDTERVSPKGARGIMQVMPATYDALKQQGFLPSDHALTSDPRTHIQAGLAALKEITKRLRTSDTSTIAADYNAGPRGSKTFAAGGNLPAETSDYLNKVSLASTTYTANDPKAAQRDVRASDNEADAGDISKDLHSTVSGGMLPRATAGATYRTQTSVADLDATLDVLKNNGIRVNEFIDKITRGRDEEAAAYQEVARQTEAAGRAGQEAAVANATVQAANSQMRERILNMLSLNTRDSDNAIARNISEFQALDDQRKVLKEDIDRRMGVGIFDDPLQWLVNQTLLPGTVARHNAMAQNQNDLIHKTEVLQKIASDQEGIDVAASADQIAHTGVALGNEKAAKANAEAAMAKAQASSASARAAATIAGLLDTGTRITIEAARLRKIIDSERAGGKSPQEQEDEQTFLEGARKISAMIGGDPAQVNMAFFKRLNSKSKDAWATRIQKMNVGDDIYEALAFVDQFGNAQRLRATGSAEFANMLVAMKEHVRNKAQLLSADYTARGEKVPPPADLMKEGANSLESEFFASRENMLVATKYNPYLANHSAMATSWKGDPGNPVYKFARISAANNIKLNDQQMFSAVVNAVENGKLTPRDAAQAVSEYWGEIIARNNTSRSPNLLGLQLQDDYKILPAESRRAIDLTNPGQVENLFISRIAAKKSAESLGFGAVYGVNEQNQVIEIDPWNTMPFGDRQELPTGRKGATRPQDTREKLREHLPEVRDNATQTQIEMP